MSPAATTADRAATDRDRRLVMAALVVAFLARLLFGLGYWVDKPLTRDEQEYLALAAGLATGRGFAYSGRSQGEGGAGPVDRAPLYPLFLAPLVAADASAGTDFRSTPTSVKVVQSAVGLLVVWLMAQLARRAAGPIAGTTAAWIGAVYPPLVWISAYALSETLFAALALGCAAVLSPALDRKTWDETVGTHAGTARLLAGGVLGGLASLVRPPMLLFLLAAGLWMLVRRGVRAPAIVAVGALLVILPWTIRNVRVHERFVAIAAQGGVTFWTGNHPLSSGEGDLAANPRVALANREFLRQHQGLSAPELEGLYYREAFQYIAQDPRWWAGLLVRKIFYLWAPIGPSYRLHSPLYFWASVIPYGLVLPFAVAGYVGLWRRGGRPWSLWLLTASALASSILYIVQERFRIPIVDPALIIGASAWLAIRRERERTTK